MGGPRQPSPDTGSGSSGCLGLLGDSGSSNSAMSRAEGTTSRRAAPQVSTKNSGREGDLASMLDPTCAKSRASTKRPEREELCKGRGRSSLRKSSTGALELIHAMPKRGTARPAQTVLRVGGNKSV